jgi:5-methylphenazine-1-carboxylate 1-monooxygenase
MKIIVLGAGIGGLTTALQLHRAGIDCAVYEQSEQLRELGVGINALPHAVKVLAGLACSTRWTPSPCGPAS